MQAKASPSLDRGLVHRLPIRIQQLEKTYDLQSVSAEQLLELLGDEFSNGRPAHVV
jgi:hypothetical protein